MELSNLEEQPGGQLVHQQIVTAGCLSVCQVAHQVVPLENQVCVGSGQGGGQSKRARTQRLRARKDEAATRVIFTPI